MLVNVIQPLLNFAGEPLKDGNVEVILKNIIINSLMTPVEGEKGEKKMEKALLAQKVFSNDEVDFDEKDILLIKDLVGKDYGPIVVYNVYNFLKV